MTQVTTVTISSCLPLHCLYLLAPRDAMYFPRQIMFETFNVRGMHVGVSAVMALHAVGGGRGAGGGGVCGAARSTSRVGHWVRGLVGGVARLHSWRKSGWGCLTCLWGSNCVGGPSRTCVTVPVR